jgi:hypothetical protein
MPHKDFAIKVMKNSFGLSAAQEFPHGLYIDKGVQGVKARIKISTNVDPERVPPTCPFKVPVAIKTNADIFNFYVPMMISVIFTKIDNPQATSAKEIWQNIPTSNDLYNRVNGLNPTLATGELVSKLH